MAPDVGKHGAAESIRMLMHIAGEKLGKLKDSVETWLEEEEKEGLFDFRHAVAVGRCIGTAAGLISGDHWIDAQLDTMALVIYDMLQKSESWYHEADQTKKAALKEILLEELKNYYLHRFENAVKENNGHFSLKLSWIDIFFFGAIEVLELYLGSALVDGSFPFLLKLIEEVGKIPAIQDYIVKRRNKVIDDEK